MEVHAGHLNVKAAGLLKVKSLINSWCVLYSGKSNFPPRLEVFASKTQVDPIACKKSIDIEDAEWTGVETVEPAFAFLVKNKRYTFVTSSEKELAEWRAYLCCVSLDLCQSKHQNISAGNDDSVIMQDNVIYGSAKETHTFDVVADQKSSCSALNFTGIFHLVFDTENINLRKLSTGVTMAVWNYYCIRNYGHSKHAINISVGHSGSTGEGTFTFLTVEGDKMVDIISQHTLQLKQKGDVLKKSTNPVPSEKVSNEDSASAHSSESSGSKISSHGSKPTPFAAGVPKPPVPAKHTRSSTNSEEVGEVTKTPVGDAGRANIKSKPPPGIPGTTVLSLPQAGSNMPKQPLAFDSNFKAQLSQTISSPHSPTESSKKPPAPSNLTILQPQPMSKKDEKEDKKRLKKMEKEAKKLERKKSKEREKEQKTIKKLKRNKDQKTVPQEAVRPVSEVDDHTYAEANDIVNHFHGDFVDSENPYNDVGTPPVHHVNDRKEGPLYAQPWHDLKIVPPEGYVEDQPEIEDIYAQPSKPPVKNKFEYAADTSEIMYEEVDLPPQIPSKMDAENDDSSNNVYDHFQSPVVQHSVYPENVYGIESASSPFAVPSSNKVDRI